MSAVRLPTVDRQPPDRCCRNAFLRESPAQVCDACGNGGTRFYYEKLFCRPICYQSSYNMIVSINSRLLFCKRIIVLLPNRGWARATTTGNSTRVAMRASLPAQPSDGVIQCRAGDKYRGGDQLGQSGAKPGHSCSRRRCRQHGGRNTTKCGTRRTGCCFRAIIARTNVDLGVPCRSL